MFILTCPSCRHTVELKFARHGAIATCTACRHLYKVDGASLRAEAGAEAAMAARTHRRLDFDTEPDDESVLDLEEVGVEAVAVTRVAEKPRPVKVLPFSAPGVEPKLTRPAPSRPGSKGGMVPLAQLLRTVRPGLPVACAAAVSAVLAVSVILLKGPPTVKDRALTTNSPIVAPDLAAAVEDFVGPIQAVPIRKATQVSTPVIPAPVVPSTLPQASNIELADAGEWSRLNPPVVPLRMQAMPTGALADVKLERTPGGEGAMRGLFTLYTGKVHENGVLNIRLLNASGLAYAEIKRPMPLLYGRQPFEMVIGIPREMMAGYDSMLVELTPGQAVSDAITLQPVPNLFEVVNGSQNLHVLKLAVRNDSDRLVQDPRCLVEAIDEQGVTFGSWRCALDRPMEPGETLEFVASVTAEQALVAERLTLRAFGLSETPLP